MGRILGVRPTSSPVVAQRIADRSSVPQSQARRSEGILALAPVVLLPAPPSTGLTPWLSGWLVKCRLPGRGGGREWEGVAKTWVLLLPRLARMARKLKEMRRGEEGKKSAPALDGSLE